MTASYKQRWNKVWILGASTGIGRELALAIAPQAAEVWISARNHEKLNEVAALAKNIRVEPLDITDEVAVAESASRIAEGGALDLVVISSAVGLMSRLPKFDVPMYRQSMEVNYLGTVYAIAAVLPAMVQQGRGHIAMIASVAGYRGLPNGAPYAPTKAALINLAECIYPNLKRLGITVSVINPGFVETPMTSKNKFPMPFLMKPEEAARRIVRGLERRRYEIAFPTRMVYLLKLVRLLPNAVFFWLADRLMVGKDRPRQDS
ncbi:MAG: SDR family NAD(P)-dependent oxidoreductase [Pirellulaceae bacterium]|nr:SDR family NAD(P)-dependent oxidoreductase [Pirellulaceae bacterium]